MKLIKINIDHYVVVDDSEIKEGDWFINETNNIEQGIGNYPYKSLSPECKKITPSTQPLEGVELLSLSEVKKLIGEVDVEKKAEKWFESQGHNIYNHYNTMPSYVSGYNQALEDNKEKKYTEEDIDKAYWAGMQFIGEDKGSFGEFIQSLQPKTEWEVEFVDGKLKLI